MTAMTARSTTTTSTMRTISAGLMATHLSWVEECYDRERDAGRPGMPRVDNSQRVHCSRFSEIRVGGRLSPAQQGILAAGGPECAAGGLAHRAGTPNGAAVNARVRNLCLRRTPTALLGCSDYRLACKCTLTRACNGDGMKRGHIIISDPRRPLPPMSPFQAGWRSSGSGFPRREPSSSSDVP